MFRFLSDSVTKTDSIRSLIGWKMLAISHVVKFKHFQLLQNTAQDWEYCTVVEISRWRDTLAYWSIIEMCSWFRTARWAHIFDGDEVLIGKNGTLPPFAWWLYFLCLLMLLSVAIFILFPLASSRYGSIPSSRLYSAYFFRCCTFRAIFANRWVCDGHGKFSLSSRGKSQCRQPSLPIVKSWRFS